MIRPLTFCSLVLIIRVRVPKPTFHQITNYRNVKGQMDALWIHQLRRWIGLSLLAFFSSIYGGFFAARCSILYNHLRRTYFIVFRFSQTEISAFQSQVLTQATNDITGTDALYHGSTELIFVGNIWAMENRRKSEYWYGRSLAVIVNVLMTTVLILWLF